MNPFDNPRDPGRRFNPGRPSSQDDLQDLARTCRDNSPPPPDDSKWKRVLTGIEEDLRTQQKVNRVRRWRAPALSAVGAVLLFVALIPFVRKADPPNPLSSSEPVLVAADDGEDVFPVANLNDVNIIRMDPRDAEQIAAGRNIFTSLVLASRSEIALHQAEATSGISVEPNGESGPILPEMQSKDGKEQKP